MSGTIHDNPARSRFELDVSGQIVFANYRRQGDALAITHVEAPVALRGKGHADRLMRGIAEIARREGFRITPYCSYAAAWLRRHRDFSDVLA